LGVNGQANQKTIWASTVADFVGVVTGDDDKDYWNPDLRYVNDLFDGAFVDYQVVDWVSLPFVATLAEKNTLPFQDETHLLVERWYRRYGLNNHQLLMGIRESGSSQSARGVARVADGVSYAHVMVKPILGLLATPASRRLLAEAGVHEIAHQWLVNRESSHVSNSGHCNDFKYYDDPSKYCQMHHTYEDHQSTTLPEFFDDLVRFHYLKDAVGVDSEYRWIRERCEPIPKIWMGAIPSWWGVSPSPCR
jgi:hypothetical protein